jgi:hypothetical protein
VIIDLFIFAAGFVAGYMVHEITRANSDTKRAQRTAERTHSDHMGLYSDPSLSHYFRLREKETCQERRSMPLREYRRMVQNEVIAKDE